MRRLSPIKALMKDHIPGQLVIQLTDRCNARCPQCGMRVTEDFPRSRLSLAAARRIIDAAAARGIGVLSLTGGEPLLELKPLLALIHHAGQAGIPYIRTGTNGFLFRGGHKDGFNDRVRRLADLMAQSPLRNFWISIDSVEPAVHQQMRGFEGVMAGIEKALPIFHRRGLFPSANLGINRNLAGEATRRLTPSHFTDRGDYLRAFSTAYRSGFERFYRFVARLGFTIVNTCYPMSVSEPEIRQGLHPVYAATAVGDVVRYTRDEKAVLFKALLDSAPAARSRLRVFSPLCSLYALHHQYAGGSRKAYACRGGIDFFFVDARKGHTYPCGYRGNEDLGHFWDLTLLNGNDGNGCRRCDWECYRDPSELFGPLLDGFHRPFELLRRLGDDGHFMHLWLQDLRYYRACDLFDGRRPPDMRRLAAFKPA